jgi:curli biogenesis system outer membrane secretion channel CsgG
MLKLLSLAGSVPAIGGHMNRRFLSAVAALAVAAWVGASPAAGQQTRPTVALLDFDFGTVQRWWSGNQDIGQGIADMMVDELVNDGSYRIIERKRLQEILAEQNFSNSERADPTAKTVAQLGKVLGVKYLIVGSVTKFGTEESKKSVGGGAFGGGRFGIGRVGTNKGKANVAITARIIDVTTGEIMASARGEATSKRSGLLLGGGGGGGAAAVGNIEFGSSDFRDTILGEATEAAVKDTVTKLVAAKTRLQ